MEQQTFQITEQQLSLLPKEILIELLTGKKQDSAPIKKRNYGQRRTQKKWTPADDEQIKFLAQKGLTDKRIAELIGRTTNSVHCRVWKLKQTGQWFE